MESVRKLCKTGVLLKNGMVDYLGGIGEIIDRYQKLCVTPATPIWENINGESLDGLTLYKMTLENQDGTLIDVAGTISDDEVYVNLEFTLQEVKKSLTIGVMMFDERGKNIYRLLNTDIDAEFNDKLHVGRNILRAKLPTDFLFSGRYDLVFDASYHNSSWISCPYHETSRMVSFNKVNNKFSTLLRREAVVAPAVKWEILN